METACYFVGLYAGDNANTIVSKMMESALSDQTKLKELGEIRTEEDVNDYGKGAFTELIGHLLYSFDDRVRRQTSARLDEIYSPVIDRIFSGRFNASMEPELRDYAFNFCRNFDLYRLSRGYKLKTIDELDFEKYLVASIRVNMRWRRQKYSENVSLDSELYAEGDGETKHDAIA